MSDEALLDERRDNLLAAILGDERLFGLAVLDITSGRFSVQEIKGWETLLAELERLNPAELLIPDDWPQACRRRSAAAYVAARRGTSIATRRTRASASNSAPRT